MPELPYEPEANVWEDFGEPNPVIVYPTVRKDLLKERIETKIEEYEETLSSMIFGDINTVVAKANTRGLIEGLELALQIIEE